MEIEERERDRGGPGYRDGDRDRDRWGPPRRDDRGKRGVHDVISAMLVSQTGIFRQAVSFVSV